MTIKKPGIHSKYLKIPNGAYKKSSIRITYNDAMKIELKKCKSDPEYFLRNYYYIQTMVGKQGKSSRELFQPFSYQIEMIANFLNFNDNIAMLARQMGKTTVVGGLILWFTMFHKDETVLICANNQLQALEIMERIQFGYENCPDFIRAAVRTDGYAKGHVLFTNGSRVVSRATGPHSGRGLSISLLYVDEFAAIHPNMQADFWAAISQTLATGGRSFITSTPYTEYDTFASLWRGSTRYTDEDGKPLDPKGPGYNEFKSIKATWKAHPFRDKEWERRQRAKMNDDQKFEREQLCEFVGYSETLIDGMILKTIMEEVDQVRPLEAMGEVTWWKKPKGGNTYIIGYDPSLGTGGDFAAIQIFELPGMEQVAEWQSRILGIPDQVRVMRQILTIIDQEMRKDGDTNPEIYWSVENNTIGEAALVIIDEIGEDNFDGSFLTEPRKTRGKRIRKGFNTTNRTKVGACSRLKTLLEKRAMKINSKELARQFNFFVAAGTGFKAKLGEHDDLVMAVILIIRMLDQVMWYDESKSSDLREVAEEQNIPPMGIF